MSRYADKSGVPVERSKTEIERLLTKYGAESFAYATEAGRIMIGFKFTGKVIRIELQLPPAKDFDKTEAGYSRTKKQTDLAWAQAMRSRWRALKMIIQAKLEAIEVGVSTLEQEFLANMVLPNGRTVGEWAAPQIQEAIERGNVPQLLLTPASENLEPGRAKKRKQ